MKTHQSRLEEIAFTMISLVGPVIARQLLATCGSIEAVFSESKRHLKAIPGIGEEIASRVTHPSTAFAAAEEEIRKMEKAGIDYCFFLDHNYPSRLKQISDAPLILY